MANRSYLYATDLIPGPAVSPADGHIIGISEWNYDIPTAFRLLLTGNPRKSTSSIWQGPEQIAIIGDYSAGVERLLAELRQYNDPHVSAPLEEARRFLAEPANQRKYFILECGEIFEMGDEPLEEQTDRLLSEIAALKATSFTTNAPKAPAKAGLFAWLFGGRKGQAPRVDWDRYGLGNWSNALYYEPWALKDNEAAAE